MTFDLAAFLATAGVGRRIVQLKPKQAFFSQGDSADSIFYLQKGRAKLTVVSQDGKEATIALLSAGDFVGEESLANVGGLHMATASAIDSCTALKISAGGDDPRDARGARLLRHVPEIPAGPQHASPGRSCRSALQLQRKAAGADSPLMAEFGKPGEPETFIPKISQETLAEMVGTTRSRVSFFMNRFRKLGLIEYNGRIQVHKSLLNVVLHDQFPERNPERPPGSATPRVRSKPAKQAR